MMLFGGSTALQQNADVNEMHPFVITVIMRLFLKEQTEIVCFIFYSKLHFIPLTEQVPHIKKKGCRIKLRVTSCIKYFHNSVNYYSSILHVINV